MKVKVTGVPHASWSQNMTADPDFAQTSEKSTIKQCPIYRIADCIDRIRNG